MTRGFIPRAGTWAPRQLDFTAENSYENPYADVESWAEFPVDLEPELGQAPRRMPLLRLGDRDPGRAPLARVGQDPARDRSQ